MSSGEKPNLRKRSVRDLNGPGYTIPPAKMRALEREDATPKTTQKGGSRIQELARTTNADGKVTIEYTGGIVMEEE